MSLLPVSDDRVLHAAGITAALLTGAVAIVLWWPR
jgi:hypothetical protein